MHDPNEIRARENDATEEPPRSGNGGSSEDFSTPSPGARGADEAEHEMAALAMELGGDLMALKAEIEMKLSATDAAATRDAAVQSLDGDNIVGVGVTMADAEDLVAGPGGGATPGQPGLVVFTIEEVQRSQLLVELASVAGTRALAEMPITQVPVGIPDAYSHRWRERPAPGGTSVGNIQITAGTQGCLSVGNQAPRRSRLMVLSNNHVLAASNAVPLGSSIVQPGAYDGGKHPADQIAIPCIRRHQLVRTNLGLTLTIPSPSHPAPPSSMVTWSARTVPYKPWTAEPRRSTFARVRTVCYAHPSLPVIGGD